MPGKYFSISGSAERPDAWNALFYSLVTILVVPADADHTWPRYRPSSLNMSASFKNMTGTHHLSSMRGKRLPDGMSHIVAISVST